MTVYDVGTYRMGNTTARTVAVWPVFIESVDVEKGMVTARWNGNPPENYYANRFKSWRKNKPVLVKSGFGFRLQTREEQKATRATP